MALRGNKMAADMGRTMTPAPEVERLARKRIEAVEKKKQGEAPPRSWRTPGYVGPDPQVFTKPSKVRGAELKGEPNKTFFSPSKVLDSTKQRDEARGNAIAAALAKVMGGKQKKAGRVQKVIET